MNLYLIRHGECLGQSDPTHYSNPDSPLSVLGEQQAVLTAKHLSRANLSYVISSPLIRALATARPIADLFNIDWEIRCKRVLEKLALLPRDSQVAMISHGGFGNYFLHSVLGLSFKQPIWFELANGSISHIRFVPNPKDERPDWPLYPPVNVEV